jgi:hypothetical protein
MDSDLSDRSDTDEHILAFDVPDDALERAGAALDGMSGPTWVYGTAVLGNCACPCLKQ